MNPLPLRAQFSPIYTFLFDDLDGDNKPDILCGGNFFGVKPELGRYDASYTTFFKGDGRGNFSFLPNKETGIVIKNEIRDIIKVKTAKGEVLFLQKIMIPLKFIEGTFKRLIVSMRKIILSISALLLIAILFIYFIPVKRSFNYKIIVQSTPALVYEELLQNTEWNNWYFNGSVSKNSLLAIQPVKQDELISYHIIEKDFGNINGTFKINISLEGESFLEWKETIYLSEGFGKNSTITLAFLL